MQTWHAKPSSIRQWNQIKTQNLKITKTSLRTYSCQPNSAKGKQQIIGSIAAWPLQSGPTVQRGGESELHEHTSDLRGQSGSVRCMCVRRRKDKGRVVVWQRGRAVEALLTVRKVSVGNPRQRRSGGKEWRQRRRVSQGERERCALYWPHTLKNTNNNKYNNII